MFRKLKRKIILINILTSAVVLAAAFAAIYLSAAGSAKMRAEKPFGPFPEVGMDMKIREEMDEQFDKRMEQERADSLSNLLVSLIVSGVVIEIAIAFFSVYLAEQAVKPVRTAYEAQKAFVANASHEIKTPLAVIQANLEAADIKGNKWLDNVGKKVEDLANLNNKLIMLAKLDALPKSEKPKTEDVNLIELVEETAGYYLPQLKKKSAKFSVKNNEKTKNFTLKANMTDLSQLVNILLDNATKYCKTKVIAEIGNDFITIKNDGTVISPESKEHIFDRFYQSEKSNPGVGLGLAIAKQLCERNGWIVTVESDKMTSFTIRF